MALIRGEYILSHCLMSDSTFIDAYRYALTLTYLVSRCDNDSWIDPLHCSTIIKGSTDIEKMGAKHKWQWKRASLAPDRYDRLIKFHVLLLLNRSGDSRMRWKSLLIALQHHMRYFQHRIGFLTGADKNLNLRLRDYMPNAMWRRHPQTPKLWDIT